MSAVVENICDLQRTVETPKQPTQQDSKELPSVYYDPKSKSYFRQDSSGSYFSVDKDMAKKFLISEGVSGAKYESESLSSVDRTLLRIQSENNVAYAAPLAGYSAGPKREGGQLILITRSPAPVQPVPGDWSTLQRLVRGMFGDDQLPYFYGWTKLAMDSFFHQKYAQAQILAIAGPPNSGKTVLASLLAEMFGGRIAKPYSYMTGATDFNADLFGAELLLIDDEAESIDIRSRRHFASEIKQFAVTPDHRCHGKNQQALILRPIRRVVVLLNDDPERLQVLPPLDHDVADKIILLKASRHPMPMPTETNEAREAFMIKLKSELPAFVHYLTQYQIPENCRDGRYGIMSFRQPGLVDSLNESTPEHQLMELIDAAHFRNSPSSEPKDGPLEGTAVQILKRLQGIHDYRDQINSLVTNQNSLGKWLQRKVEDPDSRVTRRMLHGAKIYSIQPPEMEAPVQSTTIVASPPTKVPCPFPESLRNWVRPG